MKIISLQKNPTYEIIVTMKKTTYCEYYTNFIFDSSN